MNTLNTIRTIYYGRASRTIDTILVTSQFDAKYFYVYNYEGNSFRVFKTKKDVSNFFNLNIESIIHFDNEQNLVDYLNNFVTYLEA